MFTYTKAKQIVENIKLGYIEQIVDECELEIWCYVPFNGRLIDSNKTCVAFNNETEYNT